MIKVKICGITKLREIEILNNLKVDYAGFVFAESKRKVLINQAAVLVDKLNTNIKSVGVFKNETIENILNVLEIIGLDIIQLHGNEDKEFIKKLKSKINPRIKIWKAVSINNLKEVYYELKDSAVELFLVDGNNTGSGETYNLDNIKEVIKENKNFKFILAGGISPYNVKNRIKDITPFGIDVSSNVEIINEKNERIKSLEKIQRLIENIKNVE